MNIELILDVANTKFSAQTRFLSDFRLFYHIGGRLNYLSPSIAEHSCCN